jgi:SAM-dependent methyltransferase
MNSLALKKPLPRTRSFEQVKNHYFVEKNIADRLKHANRDERKRIYATMYDELFTKVPDHPRLVIRDDRQLTQGANRAKFAMISSYIDHSTVFAEFAPGDCKFAVEVAKSVRMVYGIDISDQRNPDDHAPENFQLIVYDGYNLCGIKENSVDIVFSNDLIEHLHPEDTNDHFNLAHRLLKDGGKYIFRTPHAFTGPTDISQYFSDEPEGFHLKEWTYTELKQMLIAIGYSKIIPYWTGRGRKFRLPFLYFYISEIVIGLLPRKYMRIATAVAIPKILCVAVK